MQLCRPCRPVRELTDIWRVRGEGAPLSAVPVCGSFLLLPKTGLLSGLQRQDGQCLMMTGKALPMFEVFHRTTFD